MTNLPPYIPVSTFEPSDWKVWEHAASRTLHVAKKDGSVEFLVTFEALLKQELADFPSRCGQKLYVSGVEETFGEVEGWEDCEECVAFLFNGVIDADLHSSEPVWGVSPIRQFFNIWHEKLKGDPEPADESATDVPEPPTTLYGHDKTIHQTRHVNVETYNGEVVAVWFRCARLAFKQTEVDASRADEMLDGDSGGQELVAVELVND